MLRDFPEALEAIHRYLHDMGAIVAPTKSLNFTSSKAAKLWLTDTTWIAINAKIKVVNDLRYLGGHISTRMGRPIHRCDFVSVTACSAPAGLTKVTKEEP